MNSFGVPTSAAAGQAPVGSASADGTQSLFAQLGRPGVHVPCRETAGPRSRDTRRSVRRPARRQLHDRHAMRGSAGGAAMIVQRTAGAAHPPLRHNKVWLALLRHRSSTRRPSVNRARGYGWGASIGCPAVSVAVLRLNGKVRKQKAAFAAVCLGLHSSQRACGLSARARSGLLAAVSTLRKVAGALERGR